jgi:hypothetical protein
MDVLLLVNHHLVEGARTVFICLNDPVMTPFNIVFLASLLYN